MYQKSKFQTCDYPCEHWNLEADCNIYNEIYLPTENVIFNFHFINIFITI